MAEMINGDDVVTAVWRFCVLVHLGFIAWALDQIRLRVGPFGGR